MITFRDFIKESVDGIPKGAWKAMITHPAFGKYNSNGETSFEVHPMESHHQITAKTKSVTGRNVMVNYHITKPNKGKSKVFGYDAWVEKEPGNMVNVESND
jgi:hypothetical protein